MYLSTPVLERGTPVCQSEKHRWCMDGAVLGGQRRRTAALDVLRRCWYNVLVVILLMPFVAFFLAGSALNQRTPPKTTATNGANLPPVAPLRQPAPLFHTSRRSPQAGWCVTVHLCPCHVAVRFTEYGRRHLAESIHAYVYRWMYVIRKPMNFFEQQAGSCRAANATL
eukprot:COSAG02_NODE_1307_length_13340_cov_84.665282_8_plen_168_part_00